MFRMAIIKDTLGAKSYLIIFSNKFKQNKKQQRGYHFDKTKSDVTRGTKIVSITSELIDKMELTCQG